MATTWIIDQAHSDVQFKIKHLVISTVTGSFKQFSGQLVSQGEDFDNAEISFEIDPKSVDTNNADRDAHLRSDDFFGTETNPLITFVSTSFTKKSDTDYVIGGNLTMKGVTKEVELKAELGGVTVSPYGVKKVGFEITATVPRNDFGITFNSPLETGGLMLGEDVKLIANVQFDQQA